MSGPREPTPCARCGYSRVGRAWSRACPECGEEIPRGVDPGERQAAAAASLLVMGVAASILAGSWHPLIAGVGCLLVSAGCLAWSAWILRRIRVRIWSAQGRRTARLVFGCSLTLLLLGLCLGPVLTHMVFG